MELRIRALTFFSQRKLGITSRDDLFVFLRRIIFLLFRFSEREENIFILFVVFREREAKISLKLSWDSFFTERERELKKNFLFLFLFLILTDFIWVGSGQPTWAPKPNSNISHLHKMGWTSPITHPSPFYSTFEGHSYRQMSRVTMWAHLQFGSYKLMHLLGKHCSSTPKNYE